MSQLCSGRDFMGCMLSMRKYVDKLLDPGAIGERTLNMNKTFQMEKGDYLLFASDLNEFTVELGWTTPKDLDIDASCILLRDDDGDGDLDPQVGVGFFNLSENGVLHTSDKKQHDFANTLKSNIKLHGYGIIEAINEIVKTKDPILKTASKDPFLENACCNESDVLKKKEGRN